MKHITRKKFIVSLIFVLCGSSSVMAEEPLDLYPGPMGSLGLVTYYTHVSSNQSYSDGSETTDDGNLDVNLGIFRGVYYGELGNIPTCTNVILPFGSMSYDMPYPDPTMPFDIHKESPSGLGDVIFNTGVYLFYDEKTLRCLPISLYITAPTGEYDREKVLNMSNNRWAIKPSIGFARGIGSKGTVFETCGQVEFYTKNDKYGAAEQELEKDPFFTFQLMLTQFLDPQTFISLDYFYEFGGETEIDGVEQDDETKTHALQLALARMITPTTQLMVRYRTDISVENGQKQDTFSIRLAYLIPEFGKH